MNLSIVSLSTFPERTSFNPLISSLLASFAFSVSKVASSNFLANSPSTRFFSASNTSLPTFVAKSALIVLMSDCFATPAMITSSPALSAPVPSAFFKITRPSASMLYVPFLTCNSSVLLTLSVVKLAISAAFAFLANSAFTVAASAFLPNSAVTVAASAFLPNSPST